MTYHPVDEVGAHGSTALELDVGDADASVNDIDSDVLTGSAVESISALGFRVGLGGAQAGQTVGSTILGRSGALRQGTSGTDGQKLQINILLRDVGVRGDVELDLGVTLDVCDGGVLHDVHDGGVIGIQHQRPPLVDLAGLDAGRQLAAVERTLVDVALGDGGLDGSLRGVNVGLVLAAVVDDDEAAGDEVQGLSVGERQAHELAVWEELRAGGGQRCQDGDRGGKRGQDGGYGSHLAVILLPAQEEE